MKHKHIASAASLDWVSWQEGDHFEGSCKQLGAAANGSKLGTSLIRVPPGKKAWPAHYHLTNEEAVYILSGTGRMRLGEQSYEVTGGDYIAMPAQSDLAHQLTNTGDEDLTYLCISTMEQPEVVGYPDSDKIGVIAGSAPGGPQEQQTLTAFFPRKSEVPYWQDEH